MFIGEYQHNLDSKNRLIIPNKFREGLDDTFILTRGIDNCLAIYPKADFENFVKSLRTLSDYSSNNRMYKKMFLSSAFEVTLDSLGRIVIPTNLKKILNEKSVTLIGADDHIEIYNTQVWDAYYQNISNNIETISEDIGVKLV